MIVRLKEYPRVKTVQNGACFNSMIVRLKDEEQRFHLFLLQFQFYDSPIKRKEAIAVVAQEECFNSMIVRLKAKILYPIVKIFYLFQFYDSPIKRLLADAKVISSDKFQFYDSPIKSKKKMEVL